MKTATFAISVILIYQFVAFAGIVVLQIFLSNKENKWPGLILPIIFFGISLVSPLAILLLSFHSNTTTMMMNAEIIEQAYVQITRISAIINTAIITFLLGNIPTGILITIYAACKGKQNKQRALDKMSVQDL